MTLSRTHLFLLVLFFNHSIAKPGLLDDFILEDKCFPITGNSCFIGYDEENCNEDDWEPFEGTNAH